jgi:predicted RNA-binding protein with PIN domain
VTGRPRDPLAATTRLLVDGTNLLHALSQTAERMPSAALIGRLRGIIPADISIEIVFDGPPEHGLRGERIASGLSVRYSGTRTADSVLLSIVGEAAATGGDALTGEILVVTDDFDLRNKLRMRGARSAGAGWLLGRLDRGRLASPAAGNARPPRAPEVDDETEPRWQPGRGATAKKGPAHRPPGRRSRGNRPGA